MPIAMGLSISPAVAMKKPVPRKKAVMSARRPSRAASQPIGSAPRP